MNATQRLQARYEAALMPNYGIPPLALARGEGCRVWDADGREYTDLIAGIAVSSLGHAHPARHRGGEQAGRRLAHTSNLFLHEGEVALAERLLSLLGAPGSTGTPAARPGVLRQLGHRGQRGRPQAGPPPPGPGPPGVRGRRGRLPRPDHGRPRADRQELHPRAVRAVRGHGPVRALRRRGRAAGAATRATPPPCSSSRASAKAAVVPPPARLPAGRPATPATRPARCWWRTRSRAASAAPARGSPTRRTGCTPGRAHPGQGAGRRAAHRRLHRAGRRRHRAAQGRPRQHVRRQPGGLRRGPGRAGHHRGRRPAGARGGGRRASWRTAWPRSSHPLLQRGPRPRPVARRGADPPARRPGGGGRPGRGLPGQRRPAGRDPARPAADPAATTRRPSSSTPGPPSSTRSPVPGGPVPAGQGA